MGQHSLPQGLTLRKDDLTRARRGVTRAVGTTACSRSDLGERFSSPLPGPSSSPGAAPGQHHPDCSPGLISSEEVFHVNSRRADLFVALLRLDTLSLIHPTSIYGVLTARQALLVAVLGRQL